MSEFKDRVKEECKELEVRIEKLIEFMHGDVYPTLLPVDQGLLMVQLSHMKPLAGVLRDRIYRFN